MLHFLQHCSSLVPLLPSKEVRPEGLEPSTFGTGIQRSILLNYGRLFRYGAW